MVEGGELRVFLENVGDVVGVGGGEEEEEHGEKHRRGGEAAEVHCGEERGGDSEGWEKGVLGECG